MNSRLRPQVAAVVQRQAVTFSAVIIGETTLPIQCGEVLLKEGHTIQRVVSSDPQVTGWALERGVERLDPAADLVAILSHTPFDYLFSINNLSILDRTLMAMPRRSAINFHDGPLPRYAGLNAPSWAILKGETEYGIVWHLISDKVDEGDILVRRPVSISPGDTSLTLSAKCYEAAIESFRDLVRNLTIRGVRAVPQDLAHRTYFGRHARPAAACLIRWDHAADELSALVRALHLGSYPNPLGLPKFLVGDQVVVVSSLSVVPASGGAPGTVTALSEQTMQIATATDDVVVEGLSSLEGRVVSVRDLVQAHQLVVGSQLTVLDEGTANALGEMHRSLAEHESFWIEQLTNLEPLGVPYGRAIGTPSGKRDSQSTSWLPAHVLDTLLRIDRNARPADLLLGALATYLCRLETKGSCHVAISAERLSGYVKASEHVVARAIPFRVDFDASLGFDQAWENFRHQLNLVRSHRTFMRDVVVRHPRLRSEEAKLPVLLAIGPCDRHDATDADLAVFISKDDGEVTWSYRSDVLDKRHVQLMQRQLETFVLNVGASPSRAIGEIPLLGPDEEQRLLVEWNDTAMTYDSSQSVHQLIEMQATRSPEAVAVVAGDDQLSYAELNLRANQLANHLQGLGVDVGARIGISVKRSVDMVVGLLGILKSGAAYVPLDPAYPAERTAFIVRDAKVRLLVSAASVASGLERHGLRVVRLDAEAGKIDRESRKPPRRDATGEDLAYVIYTSGSTGTPKGVMVTHRNVLNFFHAMDRRLRHVDGGTWLAVTTISFDISVLELFWTLARGFKVVVYTGEEPEVPPAGELPPVQKTLDFSLFYFGASDGSSPEDKYRLLLEGSRFGDENGFAAVWTPERHFHEFGGLYPNPSIMGAAIATVTKRIRIRAGSVVSPLHHAIRIAEEWSAVDNLSGGRVGISFASGWQPDDFVLAPESFHNRKEVMVRQIDMVRRLWRGESIYAPGPHGQDVKVRILPRPIQPELPVWITSAGSPDTFRAAGEAGCNVLTHLLGQSLKEVAEKILAYRDAWRTTGHGPNAGHVTLMLHAFVGDSDDEVKEQVRAPMKAYLLSSVGLIQRAAWTFPAFKQATTDQGGRFALDHLSPSDLDAILDFSFERYFDTSGLLGSPAKCLRLLDDLMEIGVDEVACLLDFINDVELVLSHLPQLDAVRAEMTPRGIRAREHATPRHPVARLIEEHAVTHLQCTPSMATLLLATPGTRPALGSIQQLLIGGEALPTGLARELRQTVKGSIINMYGPTETTIWSSSHELDRDHWSSESVPIGRPIGNTRFYVLDPQLRLVPVGLVGELFIGGDGVAQGYLDRPDLEAQRFLSNPFGPSGDRLYRTGDLVRYRGDGSLEYIGRADNQVKLRGYRVELGEIESVLSTHPAVRENAVLMWGNESEQRRLVAYVVARNDHRLTVQELRDYLADRLPDYMVPAVFEFLEAMPQTPNKKIDRHALAEPRRRQVDRSVRAPRDDVERTLIDIWKRELRVGSIGTNENFFQLGGHSLLAMRVFNEIERVFGRRLPLATLFTAPTVKELADLLRQKHWTPQSTSLVAIQPDGSRPPFFGIHDLGGHVLMYQGLAHHLGPDQPFFGLQAEGLDGSRLPYHSYEDIAHHYIKDIRSVQPRGPYFLGGECLGGSLAFEVARQLNEQGEGIALLAMIDSFHPEYPKRRPYMPEAAYRALHRSRAVDFRLSKVVGLLAGRMGRVARRADPMLRTEAALHEAYAAYRPQAFSGTITLFRSQRLPMGIEAAPLMGWDQLALGGVEIHEMPTYFNTALAGTYVASLARELRNCMDRRLK